VVKFSHPNFLNFLKTAVTNGYSILFEEVEERMEPSIDSVL